MSNQLILPTDKQQSRDLYIASLGMASGFAKGYNEVADLITETTDGVPLAQMWTEFSRTVAIWNRQRSALVNFLTYNVSQLIENVRYPVEDDFQEASEFGEPTGIRLGPAFQHGYDFKWWDLAIRYTWMFLAETSSEQLAALNNQALEADNRLMFTRIMRRLFNSTTNTSTIDGTIYNVYPFYNGDAMVPPKWKNITHTAPHTHYLESGSTTLDAGDVNTMEEHLYHHGYSLSNGYQLLLLVSRQEGLIVRGFVAGAGGATYTFLPGPNIGGGVLMPANGGIIGQPSIPSIPGLNVIGTYGPWVIIEEEYIPAGYVVGLASGGPNNIGNPIGIRQHENASLQGLRLVKGRTPDYPLIDSFYLHGFGTGVRHRGAGVVTELANGGTYTIPAAYA